MDLESRPLIPAKKRGASFSKRDRMSSVLPPNKNTKTAQLTLYKGPKCVHQAERERRVWKPKWGSGLLCTLPLSPHDPAHLTSLLQITKPPLFSLPVMSPTHLPPTITTYTFLQSKMPNNSIPLQHGIATRTT